MMKRITSFVVGFLLIGLVAYLGFLASEESSYLIWFGVAAALVAPAGYSIISYGFSSGDREILRSLAAVPELEKLIDEAKTQEQKIKLLEKERNELERVVKFEAEKQFLLEKKNALETQGVGILSNLDQVDEDLIALNVEIERSATSEDIKRLHEKLEFKRRGGISVEIFGNEVFFDIEVFRKRDPIAAFFISLAFTVFTELMKLQMKLSRKLSKKYGK